MRLVVLLIALATSLARADSIDNALDQPRKVVGFSVRGKSKLKLRSLRYLSHIEEGDYVRERDRKRIVKALISSQLFEKAAVTYEDAPDGVIVVVTLQDRHSWIVAPTFYLQSGDRSVGVGYIDSDFRGLNQKAILYGQIGERDNVLFGTFLDENVRGTDLEIRTDIYAFSKSVNEYENPPNDPTSTAVARTAQHHYLGGGVLLGWNCEWWCKTDLRLRGAYVYFRDAQAPDGSPTTEPSVDGWDWTAQFHFVLDARGHDHGVTTGLYLQLMGETSIPGLDDYDYSSSLMRTYYSWKLFGGHQFELRTQLQVGRHLPIHEELVNGGVIDLRGYALDQFRGDTRATFRAEYSVPIVKVNALRFRMLGFYDAGYTGFHFRQPDGHRDYLPTQGDGAHWTRSDVGVGLRVYVGWVVVPLLGFDVAYGIEGKAPQIVFEIGFTDF